MACFSYLNRTYPFLGYLIYRVLVSVDRAYEGIRARHIRKVSWTIDKIFKNFQRRIPNFQILGKINAFQILRTPVGE